MGFGWSAISSHSLHCIPSKAFIFSSCTCATTVSLLIELLLYTFHILIFRYIHLGSFVTDLVYAPNTTQAHTDSHKLHHCESIFYAFLYAKGRGNLSQRLGIKPQKYHQSEDIKH